ncbi:hypothetical protein [Frondihabitans sucicola]|nr:hypothetical protein [Frondihabitans sucicola]
MSRIGSRGPQGGPLSDDLVLQLADSYSDRVADGTPVDYVAWEHEGEVAGWLWWSDADGAAWHIPQVTNPSSRTPDETTLIFNHPWASLMKDFHDQGSRRARLFGS